MIKERPKMKLKEDSPLKTRVFKNPNSNPEKWLQAGKSLKYNVDEIEKKIQDYFDSCYRKKRVKTQKKTGDELVIESHVDLEQVKPFTIAGISLSLEISPGTFNNWATNPELKTLDEEDNIHLKKICHLAKMRIEEYAETKLFQGNNQTGAIFWLKNNAGYADKQIIDQNLITNVSLGDLYKRTQVESREVVEQLEEGYKTPKIDVYGE